jgi:hypothetical protein
MNHSVLNETARSLPASEHNYSVVERPQLNNLNRAFKTPLIRRQPIRPFIAPGRNSIDKLIDFIVGDGPSNR